MFRSSPRQTRICLNHHDVKISSQKLDERPRLAFSLVEMLIVAGLIVLIAAFILPVLGKARESARFTSWQSYSQSLQSDPRVTLYFNFEEQEGSENVGGSPVVQNRSYGDPSGLTSDDSSNRGAEDPTQRYGVLVDSHPDLSYDPDAGDPIPAPNLMGGLPSFEKGQGRFRNKTAMQFYGGREEAAGLNSAGSYITTPNWAGITEGKSFQIAIWLKLNDTGTKNTTLSWGEHVFGTGYTDYFGLTTRDVGDQTQLQVRNKNHYAYEWGDDQKTITYVDEEWHLIAMRLAGPYEAPTGDNDNPTVAEFDDLEISIDGSPFFRPSQLEGSDVDRRIRPSVDAFVIGAAAVGTNSRGLPSQGFINGHIDEFIVWQDPTTEEELAKILRIGAPVGFRASGLDD